MKKRFFLPVVGYFIGWFYWKTLLEPWPMLLFVLAFLGWGIAIGLKKQPKGKMHWFLFFCFFQKNIFLILSVRQKQNCSP